MNADIKKTLEDATKVAFNDYRERHPNLAADLDANSVKLMDLAVESIKDDPEVIEALKVAETETVIQRIVDIAIKHLPKIIGIL